MNSTLGRRAMICKELGWSLEYVEHGISYVKLQLMIADMPRIKRNEGGSGGNEGGSGGNETKIELTDDNADEVYASMMAYGARMKE